MSYSYNLFSTLPKSPGGEGCEDALRTAISALHSGKPIMKHFVKDQSQRNNGIEGINIFPIIVTQPELIDAVLQDSWRT